VMIICSLFIGAEKHWRGEKAMIALETQALEAAIHVRAETAHNLLTVARRYLPGYEALCQSVSGQRAAMLDAALPLADRMQACRAFTQDAKSLLAALSARADVQADSRDQMYAVLMLPQAVEQCEDEAAFAAYDMAAGAYNEELTKTFSGLLSQILGYQKAPLTTDTEAAVLSETAERDYPAQRGYVNDDAAVLSEETAFDIQEMNARMSGAEFYVVTRHFLGGVDAQEYCRGLFDTWQLDEDDVLMLLVIGEERYAVCLGEKISEAVSAEQLNTLTSTNLRDPFINQRDYDGAAGQFLLALGGQIARANGESLNTGGLFGTEEGAPDKVFENWSGNWWEGFFAEEDYDEEALQDYARDEYWAHDEEEEETGLGTLIVLAALLYLIVRRRRRHGKGGLGLIGWLFALTILNEIGNMLGVM